MQCIKILYRNKLESHEREMLDVKHNFQDKSNKLFLLKEKNQMTELNLEAKSNEVKRLHHEIRELNLKISDMESVGPQVPAKHVNSDQISILQSRIKELESQIEPKSNKDVNQFAKASSPNLLINSMNSNKNKDKNQQQLSKKSKGSLFDDLNLDDDGEISDGIFERDFNETEKLKQIKPERDFSFTQSDLEKYRKENLELKSLITQMKDEMINVQKYYQDKENSPHDENKIDSHDKGEITFFRNSNKKLAAQLEAEQDKFLILQKELEIKAKELEIANSSITNMSKKIVQKDKDIEILINKLKDQK